MNQDKYYKKRPSSSSSVYAQYELLDSSPYATIAATGLPLYRLRAERLRGLTFRKSRRLLSALRLNARKDSGHCRWRVNVHRLSSSGRAESVRQSLPGMRSWQSQPHGCYQMSGFAAGVTQIQVKNIEDNTATNAKSFSASQDEDAEEPHQSTDQYPR